MTKKESRQSRLNREKFSIAPRIDSNKGIYSHKCRECLLIFTAEDAREGLFVLEDRSCIRCKANARMHELGVSPPSCFGVSYNPSNFLCSSKCGLKKACRIENVENVYDSRPISIPRGKHQTLASHMARILRAVGKPVHVDDIAPTLERESGGRYKVFPGINNHLLRRYCQTHMEIISLGDGFYVWSGIWDGEFGSPDIKISPGDVLKIEEILEKNGGRDVGS